MKVSDAGARSGPEVVVVQRGAVQRAGLAGPDGERAPDREGPDGARAPAPKREPVGPARWMAQHDPETLKAINDMVRNSPAPAEIRRQNHRKSVHLEARALVSETALKCARKLPPRPGGEARQGRIVATVRLSAAGTEGRATGRIDGISARPTWLLNEPVFHACFQGALLGKTFPVSGPVAGFTTQLPVQLTAAQIGTGATTGRTP